MVAYIKLSWTHTWWSCMAYNLHMESRTLYNYFYIIILFMCIQGKLLTLYTTSSSLFIKYFSLVENFTRQRILVLARE